MSRTLDELSAERGDKSPTTRRVQDGDKGSSTQALRPLTRQPIGIAVLGLVAVQQRIRGVVLCVAAADLRQQLCAAGGHQVRGCTDRQTDIHTYLHVHVQL